MSVPDETFGYGRLTKTLALDHDLSMFRRFAALNIRNILYLQSELQALELKLHRIDNNANDISKGNAIWGQPRSWYWASRSQDTPDLEEESEKYWDVVLKIRELLEKYNTALRHQAWMQSLKSPSERSWSTLHAFIENNRTMLSEADAKYMAMDTRHDLAALTWREKEILSLWMEEYLMKLFKKKDDNLTNHEMGFISEEKIALVVRLLAILLSSVLPILSIVLLYVIRSTAVRLGVIIICSVLCSLALALLSNARNAEILAVTAAYAAVQVVFVGGNINSS